MPLLLFEGITAPCVHFLQKLFKLFFRYWIDVVVDGVEVDACILHNEHCLLASDTTRLLVYGQLIVHRNEKRTLRFVNHQSAGKDIM